MEKKDKVEDLRKYIYVLNHMRDSLPKDLCVYLDKMNHFEIDTNFEEDKMNHAFFQMNDEFEKRKRILNAQWVKEEYKEKKYFQNNFLDRIILTDDATTKQDAMDIVIRLEEMERHYSTILAKPPYKITTSEWNSYQFYRMNRLNLLSILIHDKILGRNVSEDDKKDFIDFAKVGYDENNKDKFPIFLDHMFSEYFKNAIKYDSMNECDTPFRRIDFITNGAATKIYEEGEKLKNTSFILYDAEYPKIVDAIISLGFKKNTWKTLQENYETVAFITDVMAQYRSTMPEENGTYLFWQLVSSNNELADSLEVVLNQIDNFEKERVLKELIFPTKLYSIKELLDYLKSLNAVSTTTMQKEFYELYMQYEERRRNDTVMDLSLIWKK